MDRRPPRAGSSLATDLHVEATYRLTEALVEAENRMRRRVELLTEVVFETDAGGSLVFLNGAWATATGHPVEGCIGRPLRDFVHEADWPVCAAAFSGDEPSPDSLQPRPVIRVQRADARIAWMELSVARIPAGGAVGALHDVTARKQAEDELAKLSLVASYTDNLVVITDRDGRTEWVNQAFRERTGYDLGEVIGIKPGELLQGPDTDPETVREIGRLIRDGRSFSSELLNYSKAGEPYWVRFDITPVRGPDGEVERFVSIQTDSTELHRTQLELEAAKSKAESASEAKTQFLATISHEMRTPLGAILGSSDLAMESMDDPIALRAHLTRIGDSADVLQRLISDLLDVSKIEAGQIDIERVPMELRAALRAATGPIGEVARARGLDFRLMVDETLPAWIQGDPGRLRQIVSNLAENAVKFTDRGSVRVEALAVQGVLGASAGAVLEIRVIDTGPGISDEAQTRIFNRFEQGDGSTTRRKGGAGLGLNIVKSLTEALGGTVQVQSRPGAGADFRIRLPLVVVPEPVVRHAPVGEGRASGGLAGALGTGLPCVSPEAPRILVAEDSDANFAVVQIYLGRGGYQVERAQDGREAVAAAPRCDLILMDVEMPVMDGLEATRRIRAGEAERGAAPVPIIALTAHALEEYRQRCLAAGCTGYLSKPVRMNPLLEAVAAALEAGLGAADRRPVAVVPVGS
ncbi:MAG: ATP-binding protein [Chloroflexota bacterium]